MDWMSGMQNAINYMEDNILNDIDYNKIAECAYSSTFHFQRMFSMLTGFTIGEYIRNRRLTLSAQELAVSNVRVTDIAPKYGYETPEAFTKAFQRLHGVTPSAAREQGVKLKSFNRLSIQVTVKGNKEMNYKIVEKEAFKVFGKDFKTSISKKICFKEIPELCRKYTAEGIIEKILKCAGKSKSRAFDAGVLFDHNHKDGTMSYMMACDLLETKIPDEFKVLEIPKLTWAVFEVDGNRSVDIQAVWRRISSEWFPASNYEHAYAPEMERFYDTEDADYRCEVWVPVVKKNF